MRRALLALSLAAIIGLGTACVPTASVTATPSTTRPACKAITTVTGKVTPANAVNEVKLEVQAKPGGPWAPWQWFENADDGMGTILAKVNQTSGAYSLTYLAPNNISKATTRLRIHGSKFKGADVVSASWYVTRPSGC